jgi:hypothetical protein
MSTAAANTRRARLASKPSGPAGVEAVSVERFDHLGQLVADALDPEHQFAP